MSAHKHAWTRVAHIDGCHWYAWSYKCACGATASTHTERSVKDDPCSAVWMEPTGKDGGYECARCQALMQGAEPKHNVEITEAKS